MINQRITGAYPGIEMMAILTLINEIEQLFTTSKIQHQLFVTTS